MPGKGNSFPLPGMSNFARLNSKGITVLLYKSYFAYTNFLLGLDYSSTSIISTSFIGRASCSPLMYTFVISWTALLWIVMLVLNFLGALLLPSYVTKIVSCAPGFMA